MEVESSAHCPEQNDAEEEELELERCLCKEMDEMGSSSDISTTSEGIQGVEEGESKRERGKLTNGDAAGEAGTLSEWLNFMRSAQGLTRYMETATTEIQEVSKLLAFSAREEHQILKTDRIGVAKNVDEEESERANMTRAPSSGSSKRREILQGGMDERTSDNFPMTVPPTPCHHSERFECMLPNAVAPIDDCNAAVAQGEVSSAQKGATARDSPIIMHVSAAVNTTISERNGNANAILSSGNLDSADSAQISPSLSEGLDDEAGCLDARVEQITTAVKEEQAMESSSPLFPSSDRRGPVSPVQENIPDSPLSAEKTALLVDDECCAEQAAATTANPKVPLTPRSLGDKSFFSRELEGTLEQQLKRKPQNIQCRVSETDNATDIMAYVGENEVSRRIGRATEQALERRQRHREERSQQIKRQRSTMVLQATWRGRCVRTVTAPTRAARQRETMETMFMFEEELATARLFAVEAERKEIEDRHQSEELSAMRYEDQRTRRAWEYLFETVEMVRQEELARMRAEERGTRAFIDLEREETGRLTRIRRETEETLTMMSEDAATRDFIRNEDAEMTERHAKDLEDASSKKRETVDLHQQAISRVEVSLMVGEDDLSLTWNVRYRSEREACRRMAQAKSTPIQQAMDPRGLIMARRLVADVPPCSGHRAAQIGHNQRKLAFADHLEPSRLLMLDRTRRRGLYRCHLDSILKKNQEYRSGQDTENIAKALRGKINNERLPNVSDRDMGDVMGRQSHLSPSKQRRSPAGKDGTDCALTADMLSHLGPLQNITGMELCVEGLTSVSLLRTCTSLKSLSLNVNRLSSPTDLTMCTALVRLSLRDNRLSSLEGLAGLPNLRELRLDINHLTSLHELKSLPSLVELSANTNHIKELPKRFAAGLMSSLPQSRLLMADSIKSCPRSATKSTLTPCVLQKLELYHNRIAVVHPRALEEFGSLTYLDLGRNQLKSLDGRAMEICPALSTLILSQNFLREPPFPMRLPLLTELWLSGNQISTMGQWAIGLPQDVVFPCSEPHLGALPQSERRDELRADCELRQRNEVMSSALKSGKSAAEGFVWLPSLVVLHLEDNAVESLGERWSLAGCPSLRFLDVSFNRLRTLDDLSPCLKACGELKDVRLHDNPVWERGLCTDIMSLNCAKLERVDGVSLDHRARWRAGMKVFNGRSDLVSPFLLRASQASVFRLGGENSLASPQKDGSGSLDISRMQVDSLVKCPWCGTALSTTKSVESAPCRSQGGHICASSVFANSREGREHALAAGKSKSPRRRKTGQPVKSVGDGFNETRKNACAICGLVPPDTSLWSVSNPTDADLSFEWDDVLSAGHRWRCDLRSDPRVIDSIVNDDEESEIANTFQEACHRGCEKRAQMMRRHRREQRDLASTASVFGETSRAKNAGGSDEVRSASAVSSTRVLELELELWERHARERKDIADRLLRLHSSGGIVHADICKGQKGHHVLVDLQQSVVEGIASATAGLRWSTANAERVSNSVGQRIRAASIVQCIWRRRQERSGFATRRHLDPDVTGPANERAVTTLQSAFRGFHVRRMLQAALDSARYVDDELEGLLEANGGDCFELDRFLSSPPELAEDWMNDAPTTQISVKANMPGRSRAVGNRFVAAARALVSNTPRRSENATNGQSDGVRKGKQSSSNGADTTARAGGHGGSGARVSSYRFIEAGVRECLDQEIEDELNTACSHADTETRGGRKSEDIGALLLDGEVKVEDVHHGSDSGREDGIAGDVAGNELIRAWGLKDPMVATMMLKRMKRLRRFHTSEARRAKMRNPDARFEAFVKKAGGHRRAHTTIDSCHSDQPGGLDTHRSGASDVGSRNESPRASPQPAPAVASWAGKGKVSRAAPSTAGLRPQNDAMGHIPNVHLSPDEGQTLGPYPPSTPSSYATQPWPPSSQSFPCGRRGDTGATAGGCCRPRATLRSFDLGAQVSSGGLRRDMERREEEQREKPRGFTFGASGRRAGENRGPP